MDIKKALSKIFKIFVPVSLVVGSLIFSLSNVRDFKPVHADSGYSLTIDGGSTIAFTQQDVTTYTAEINENAVRNGEIFFFEGTNQLLYSSTCYADYEDPTNNLYNNVDGAFIVKYGVKHATVTLTIIDGVYKFKMDGLPASLKESSKLVKPGGKYYENRLYCIRYVDFGTTYTAVSYDYDNSYLVADKTGEPLYFTVKENDNNFYIKLISANKFLCGNASKKANLVDNKETDGTLFSIPSDDTIKSIKLGYFLLSIGYNPQYTIGFIIL